jgi:hypothetical protein
MSIQECDTCGEATDQIIQALYVVVGLGHNYKSTVNTCAYCLEEVKDFRPHHTEGMKWKLVLA